MAINKPDLSAMGRDLVMKTLDGVADKFGSGDTPQAVQQLATKWKSMTESDRDDVARYVAMAVQGALAVVPLVAAAAVKKARAKRKRPAPQSASPVITPMKAETKRDKKDKKDKKKKNGKVRKDKKEKKKKKKK